MGEASKFIINAPMILMILGFATRYHVENKTIPIIETDEKDSIIQITCQS